jgi:copper resistance protein B
VSKFVSALTAIALLGALSDIAHAQATPADDHAGPYAEPHMLDEAIFVHGIFNQLEGRFGDSNTFRWSGEAWAGTDENRIWLKTEGRLSNGELDDGIQELLYSRAITTYFNAQVGARYDLDALPGRGWGAIGIEGLAPQFFRVGVTGYVSGEGHLAAKLEASYDLLLTQRLILQPQIEMNFYTKDDPARLVGAGLSELDAGLRLRYEITRKLAPYFGVTYLGQYGATANYVNAAGGQAQQVRFTLGVRAWF